MYSDDPGKSGLTEHQIENQINEFRSLYAGEEFGIIQTAPDIYKVFNRKRTVEGTIDLRNCHADIQQSD